MIDFTYIYPKKRIMNPFFESVPAFSTTLETWQSLYKEVVLTLCQTNREVNLSKSLIQSTLQKRQLLEAKCEQLEQQLSALESLIDHRVFS